MPNHLIPPNLPNPPHPQSPIPNHLLYACLYVPPQRGKYSGLVEIAQAFSPRYQVHRDDLVVIDVAGLERLLGPARAIGEELRKAIAARGIRGHVAIAG